MSSKRTDASDAVHPAARPFLFLFRPGLGLFIVIALAAVLVASFAVEFVVSGSETLSKYPEVLGAYEWMPILAAAGAILFAWVLHLLLSAGPNFYERAAGDDTDAAEAN